MTNYPWQHIDPKDEIQVESLDALTMKDVHVLTKLYQPLIGAPAYTFYMNLFASLDFQNTKKQTTVSELLRKLDIGIPDFFHARIKLEGIGLLGIYRAKAEKGKYIYEIVAPMTAEEFFKDSLLRTLLAEKIGQRLFEEEMRGLLSEPASKEGYEETTRSFIDVYHFDFENTSQLSQTDFMPFDTQKKRSRLTKTIDQIKSFDYDFFKQGLNKHFVDQDSFTKEVKELMYTYHVIYGIDELTMQQLILESADVHSGKVNPKKMARNMEIRYANQQKAYQLKTQSSQAVEQAVDEPLREKGFTAEEIAIIKHAKNAAPVKYLEAIKKQKNGFVGQPERYVLKDLIEQSPLRKEVINLLMYYILMYNNNPTLDKNYTLKIANEWSQNGVHTAEDAMERIKSIDTSTQAPKSQGQNRRNYSNYSNYNRRPVQKEKLPNWAKDTNKNTASDDQVISDQQAESIQERLDRLRKLRQEKEDN